MKGIEQKISKLSSSRSFCIRLPIFSKMATPMPKKSMSFYDSQPSSPYPRPSASVFSLRWAISRFYRPSSFPGLAKSNEGFLAVLHGVFLLVPFGIVLTPLNTAQDYDGVQQIFHFQKLSGTVLEQKYFWRFHLWCSEQTSFYITRATPTSTPNLNF